MKVLATQTLVSAAFRKLAALTRIEAVLEQVHALDDLVEQFQALRWDEKVFTLTGDGGVIWVAEVAKEGPALTLTPNRPDLDGSVRVDRWNFWNEFVRAIQAEHPAFHLSSTDGLLKRLFTDGISESRRHELARHHHEDEVLNQHRRQLRNSQRQEDRSSREAQAEQHRAQYALWYQ